MPCTSPDESPNEITSVHFMCIQPLDEASFHPLHHEMLSPSSALDPELFFEDPYIEEHIHFDYGPPHREFFRRTRIVEMLELPFAPASEKSNCPLHKDLHPGSKPSQEGKKPSQEGKKPSQEGKKPSQEGKKPSQEGKKPSQEGPEKATSLSSSEPKGEEKLERASDGGGEKAASQGDANHLSPSKDPDDTVGMMYTYTLEYQWSPMLKYCTMEEMGYQPLQVL